MASQSDLIERFKAAPGSPSALAGKTLVLGIGAQKAGTSWLYRFLHAHPAVFMASIKELHYFDQLFRPDLCSYFGRHFQERLTQRLRRSGRPERDTRRREVLDLLDRVRMNQDPQAYFQFFERRVPADRQVFGEISPSYSLIPAEGFAAMRNAFDQRGIHVRIVFLMRDPVERFYSALRMKEGRGGSRAAEANFYRKLGVKHHVWRGRYDLTWEALTSAFPESQVFTGFYETLFNEASIRRLCDFIGVDYQASFPFDEKVNVSPREKDLTPEMIEVGRKTFEPVYRFCWDKFGDRVPATWLAMSTR